MKIYLDSIGCRLNQGEIEKMAAQFRAAGHELTSNEQEADLVVINTCAVTSEAASDSRGKARHAARAGVKQIVLTGCWATLDPQAAAELPFVMKVVDNEHKDHLVADVLDLPQDFDLEPMAREPLPGLHQRTRAFIKVQDGCDNYCTYCITRLVRGQARSVPVETVLADIRLALRGGVKEVVLSGVHMGSWGHEMQPAHHLRHLVQAVLAETGAERVRLSSLEPWDLDEDFFDLWQDERLCRHLHLPLQSGCAATLRRMARNVTPESFQRILDQARAAAEDMAITTDMIVGFPGETDEEFGQSLQFARQAGFSAGHVFTYSARPGTAAARYPNPVPGKIARERSAELRAMFTEASRVYRQKFVGSRLPVLWEAVDQASPQGWRMSGWTGNYIRVQALSPQPLWNQITPVSLTALNAEGMDGVLG